MNHELFRLPNKQRLFIASGTTPRLLCSFRSNLSADRDSPRTFKRRSTIRRGYSTNSLTRICRYACFSFFLSILLALQALPAQAQNLENFSDQINQFFQSAVDWGIAASQVYLVLIGGIALVIYLFKR